MFEGYNRQKQAHSVVVFSEATYKLLECVVMLCFIANSDVTVLVPSDLLFSA